MQNSSFKRHGETCRPTYSLEVNHKRTRNPRNSRALSRLSETWAVAAHSADPGRDHTRRSLDSSTPQSLHDSLTSKCRPAMLTNIGNPSSATVSKSWQDQMERCNWAQTAELMCIYSVLQIEFMVLWQMMEGETAVLGAKSS